MTSLEACLVFSYDFRRIGNRFSARRNVPMTLTLMVISVPSLSSYVFLKMPAFSTTTSILSSELHLEAKDLIESYLSISRCHTWTTFFRFVDASIDALAASPFSSDLTARMTTSASSRTKCLAASNPKPVLDPVIMMVWPWNEVVGTGMRSNCPRMASMAVVSDARIIVNVNRK